MARAEHGSEHYGRRPVSVAVPASADLQRLLTANGARFGKFGRYAGALANAADPVGYPQRAVEFDPPAAREVGFVLAALLGQALADGDPGAGALGELAAQFPGAGDSS